MKTFKEYTMEIARIIKGINQNKNIILDNETTELMTIVSDCFATLQCEGMQEKYVNQFNKYSSQLLTTLVTKGILK
tara:strand:+ start:4218 stop:4445 length:228 start_codon:yes stop_codon:yes gene_type:complete